MITTQANKGSQLFYLKITISSDKCYSGALLFGSVSMHIYAVFQHLCQVLIFFEIAFEKYFYTIIPEKSLLADLYKKAWLIYIY